MGRRIVILTDAQIANLRLAALYMLELSPEGDGDGPRAGSPEARSLEAARDALDAAKPDGRASLLSLVRELAACVQEEVDADSDERDQDPNPTTERHRRVARKAWRLLKREGA